MCHLTALAINFNFVLLVVELVLLIPTLLLLVLGRREERGRRTLLERITTMVKLVSTQEYFNTIHASMQKAKTSVRGIITGSAPKEKEQEDLVKSLVEEIKTATKRGVTIRYLLPKLQDRLRVASMYSEGGAEVRFHSSLIATDLRYVVVDDKKCVLGLPETAGQNEPTREGFMIPSEGLSSLLNNQFDSKWSTGIKYDEYVGEILNEIRSHNPNLSNTLLSEQLHIPESEVARISAKTMASAKTPA